MTPPEPVGDDEIVLRFLADQLGDVDSRENLQQLHQRRMERMAPPMPAPTAEPLPESVEAEMTDETAPIEMPVPGETSDLGAEEELALAEPPAGPVEEM